MLLFYQPDISLPLHTLDQEESKHCIRVLRMKTGDTLHLTDGKGMLHQARIVEDSPKRCTVEIIQTKEQAARAAQRIHLAVAPTKNINRYEWFLEKATEIGVDEITPLICENSERKVVKPDRLEKVLVAAMKQSLKSFLPLLNEAVTFDRFVSLQSREEKFIAYCSDEYRSLLKESYTPGHDALILVGPEGDFSVREVELAKKNGFRLVSLGSSRLRTETAAVVASHTLQLMNEK